jgi:transposase-like protein
MKRKRYTEEKIISILKQHEAGRSMVDLAREYGIAENTLYRWKSKSLAEKYPRYGCPTASLINWLSVERCLNALSWITVQN